MLRVDTLEQKMAAVLHDVVEDTSITLEYLVAEGFPRAVTDAVEALTKRTREDGLAAARRAVANPIARIVKLADNTENMDMSRMAEPTDKDFARLKEYEAVRAILLAPTAE